MPRHRTNRWPARASSLQQLSDPSRAEPSVSVGPGCLCFGNKKRRSRWPVSCECVRWALPFCGGGVRVRNAMANMGVGSLEKKSNEYGKCHRVLTFYCTLQTVPIMVRLMAIAPALPFSLFAAKGLRLWLSLAPGAGRKSNSKVRP